MLVKDLYPFLQVKGILQDKRMLDLFLDFLQLEMAKADKEVNLEKIAIISQIYSRLSAFPETPSYFLQTSEKVLLPVIETFLLEHYSFLPDVISLSDHISYSTPVAVTPPDTLSVIYLTFTDPSFFTNTIKSTKELFKTSLFYLENTKNKEAFTSNPDITLFNPDTINSDYVVLWSDDYYSMGYTIPTTISPIFSEDLNTFIGPLKVPSSWFIQHLTSIYSSSDPWEYCYNTFIIRDKEPSSIFLFTKPVCCSTRFTLHTSDFTIITEEGKQHIETDRLLLHKVKGSNV